MKRDETETTMKAKEVISCRPDDTLKRRFMAALEMLGVDMSSELARRSIHHGLEKAANEIAGERRREAEKTLKQLSGRLSFNSPLTHGDHVSFCPVG
jgi:antitoxin component of RelBE/YafQ-DinJ toxin-antitoxin module